MNLFVNKTLVVWEQFPFGNQIIVGGPVTIKLHGITSNCMAGVIRNRVIISGFGAMISLRNIGHIERVAKRPVMHWVI